MRQDNTLNSAPSKLNQKNEDHQWIPLDRREYLQYTGALVSASTVGSRITAGKKGENDPKEINPPTPDNLQVEYERNPKNLDPRGNPPRFFWELSSSERSVTQTAYRVLVANSETALQNENGTEWDSGKVSSDESTAIEYDGFSLDPDTTYHWAVRIWDGEENTSPWNTSTFTTAIPGSAAYWDGDWLGADLGEIDLSEGFRNEVTLNPLLRKEFDITKDVTEARLHISGLGFNEPYLNGDRIGDHVLDPAITDYESTILYSTYDVTEEVQTGENVIGVALGRGRFGEPAKDNGGWGWSDAPWWGDPQVLVQLNVEFTDGTATSIVTDDTWQVTDAPTRYDSLFSGELYDARQEEPGWTDTSFDDADWEAATVESTPGGDVEPQRTPPIRTHGTIEPVSRSNPKEDVYVFDMGVNFSGWARLTIDGPEGTEVTLSMGEKLNDDGTVTTDTGLIIPPAQEDVYVLNGEGIETWEASFSYKGFRYLEVKGFPGTPTAANVEGVVVHTDIESGNKSDFVCSNDLLNQIHENTRRAIKNNYHGLPTDTPLYEKNGWTADAHATAQTAIYNFDVTRFYEKWLRDMRDAQTEEGAVATVVPTTGYSIEPNPGWEAVAGPVPAWDAAYFLMPWVLYQHTGDSRILRDQYDALTRYMGWFREQFDGHTPNMGLGDWVSPGENELHICSTCYYYRELDILAKAARVLGHDDDAATYESLRSDVADALNKEFYDSDGGYYGTDDVNGFVQTSNILPLAFGMVPDERVDTVVDALVEDIMDERDGHLYTGLLGTKHILPVLTEYGHHDVAYAVATQTTYPSWGHWIVNGMTSLLESWSLDTRSRNHHFLGAIDEWFYRYLAGIRTPAEPGFEHIEIAPLPVSDLDRAAATTETVRGTIASSWQRAETSGQCRVRDGLVLEADVPGNTTATIRIPTLGDNKVRVREREKTIWNNGNATRPRHPGVESVTRDGDAVVVEVGSGEYQFELEPLGK